LFMLPTPRPTIIDKKVRSTLPYKMKGK
jgi:hypothetical protein